MQLTKNFALAEFEESFTAKQHNVDNSVPIELYPNAYRLAEWLQVLRARLTDYFGSDIPIRVQSGFRSIQLNELVNGSITSEHLSCLAADINALGVTPRNLAKFIRENMDDLGYDQCINEFDSWVHIGLSSIRKRNQNLVACKNDQGRTVYKKG